MLPLLVITLLGLSWTSASTLPCPQTSPSLPPPSTVHNVKPSDVAVLSAIGLSHSHSELSKVVSIFQELMSLFNPSLTSPLLDQTNLYSPDFLQHGKLVEQAKEMLFSLRKNQDIDVDRDWKLVLLFVQADQICSCEEQQVTSTVKATVQQVDLALQVLHSQLKRTIVSVAVWDGEFDTRQKRRCPCMETMSEGELRLLRATLAQVLQESLDKHMVQKQWYGDRDDFTVVLQDKPFMADLAYLTSGRTPSEVQSSQHTDTLIVQMWANVLQPTSGHHNTEDNEMTIAVPCPTEDRPFLRTEQNSPSYHPSQHSPLLDHFTGSELPCEDLVPSQFPPTSVHALRPADIKVVAALGDSLTAGNGIGANPNNLLDVLRQYRGLSWSIGGAENLTTVTTLPNILKQFNPLVTGYSVGFGNQDSPQTSLNQAVAGEKSKGMPKQVRTLVARMKNNSHINFESDWKVITVFVGSNDLCDHCQNSLYHSIENYVHPIREALDYLHKEVPRVLVNLVEPFHISKLREMHRDPSLKCPTWLVNFLCPCVILPKDHSKALQQLDDLNRGYQRALNELVESGRYDTHSNFTVVVQPFFREIIIPKLVDGRPDRSFFSSDCFHLSQKAQTLMARSLWNSMLEPLGFKTEKHNFSSEIPLKCPSKASPFVRTHLNSNYTYGDPTPTPPITNWGSDFSCADLAPSNSVPASVHKLRPGDIKVVAALGDSSTAGTGAKAENLSELKKEYKGVSWSIGGDQTLETVTTLPNILRKFNPLLYGFSKGQGSSQKGFNMAVPGAVTSEIPAQIQALIKAIRENKNVNFEEDWKLVTLFVGGNDLCQYCFDQNNLSPKNYSRNLMLSLDMLYNELPRALVNMVEVLQIDPLRTVKGEDLGCTLMQKIICPCVLGVQDNSPELEEIRRINLEYQTETQHLVSGNRYDGREDFAVVLQPFFRNFFVPYIGEGEADLSFFSVDCFHISERAHAEMAIALWNNMLEPVGRKQVYNNFTYDRSKMDCPSEARPYIFTKMNSLPSPPTRPYIFTKMNSLPSPPVTSTTPTPVVTTSSSLTALPTEPAPRCPSSIPVWVPVVLAITSLLLGIAAASLFLSCRQRQKKNKENAVEMKGAAF